MRAAAHEWRLQESWPSSSSIIQPLHKRAQIPCLHGWANCVFFHQKEDISKTPTHAPPKCDRRALPSWQEQPDQKRQRWTFAVAQNAATGNRKVTQAVPAQSRLSFLSDTTLALYNYFPLKSEAFFLSFYTFHTYWEPPVKVFSKLVHVANMENPLLEMKELWLLGWVKGKWNHWYLPNWPLFKSSISTCNNILYVFYSGTKKHNALNKTSSVMLWTESSDPNSRSPPHTP